MTIGFLFVGIPLLVHLINLLRHRRRQWAAMDFLLASYRKQRKWIVLRQLLLLLSRLALAALLIALLAGWTGGRRLLGAFGGQTTHHVILLDDSYSMGDASGGETAYRRALRAIDDLTRRLASDDGNHQLTVLRASRAALALRGGSTAGDAVADLSGQTVTADGAIINRVMASEVSPLRTDLVPAIDLAAGLLEADVADRTSVYLLSDFRRRDWESAERIAESLRPIDAAGHAIRMIDCGVDPAGNLAITELSPRPDVWVAGVPVVMRLTVTNFGPSAVNNVPVEWRVIRYGDGVTVADPTRSVSGQVEPQPTILIESLAAGESVTKTFQVFIAEPGTHAVEAILPEDALAVDNRRTCVLPLTDAERVLVIDGDPDGRGGYHVASVLDPGSQVRIGAVPELQPPSYLRSVTAESLARFRAVYLIDVDEIGEGAAAALHDYVRGGGGLSWFLGSRVNRESYNAVLLRGDRRLLPAPLGASAAAEVRADGDSGSVGLRMGDPSPLLEPIAPLGDAAFRLVGLSRSWTLGPRGEEEDAPRVIEPLRRGDGLPLVTQHDEGRGRVVTVLTGLDGSWTNWAGDPTFVVFLLQTNAMLWSSAAPATARPVDEPLHRLLPPERYAPQGVWLPPAIDPPRVPFDVAVETSPASRSGGGLSDGVPRLTLDPVDRLLAGGDELDDVLRPGVFEWMLTRDDGSSLVVPGASVIRVEESRLERVDAAEIRQSLSPIDVRFVTSSQWSDENRGAGHSTLALVMLGMLAGLLGAEQWLAYWASYHTSAASGGGKRR